MDLRIDRGIETGRPGSMVALMSADNRHAGGRYLAYQVLRPAVEETGSLWIRRI